MFSVSLALELNSYPAYFGLILQALVAWRLSVLPCKADGCGFDTKEMGVGEKPVFLLWFYTAGKGA